MIAKASAVGDPYCNLVIYRDLTVNFGIIIENIVVANRMEKVFLESNHLEKLSRNADNKPDYERALELAREGYGVYIIYNSEGTSDKHGHINKVIDAPFELSGMYNQYVPIVYGYNSKENIVKTEKMSWQINPTAVNNISIFATKEKSNKTEKKNSEAQE
jgi:hypothetical protein